jgi:hypothetical protein
MTLEWVKNLAFARMPKIDAQVVGGTHRHEVIRTLAGANNIGIELGVAQGVFAERMLRSGKFARYFGVDCYGDPWGTPEYKAALKRIGLSAPFHLAGARRVRRDRTSAVRSTLPRGCDPVASVPEPPAAGSSASLDSPM